MSIDDLDALSLCTNPASPSYGRPESRQSTSLPTPDRKRMATSYTPGYDSNNHRDDTFIEDISSDDSDTPRRSINSPNESMAGVTSHYVMPLSFLPNTGLVTNETAICTGPAAFFQISADQCTPSWVFSQTRRLTHTYKAVVMFPFAAAAADLGKLPIIRENMKVGWRTIDAAACYYGLSALKSFFITNVTGPLYCSDMSETPFDTAFTHRSQNGSGVRSFIIEACRQAAVNLIVVGNQQVFDGEMDDLAAVAHKSQPCLVLFDRCDNWFMDEYPRWGQAYVSILQSYQSVRRSSFHAALGFGEGITARSDNVWTIFSLGLNGSLHGNFYATVGQNCVVCTQPSLPERLAAMTKTVSNLYSAHVGEANIQRVQAAASDIEHLVQQYCGCMSTASVGEMHEMIQTLTHRKQKHLIITGGYRPPMEVKAFMPTAADLDAEIRSRRARADQHASESHRLAPVHK